MNVKILEVETVDGWLPLAKYCAITGETEGAVHTRVSKGIWKRGVHFSSPDSSRSWVNLAAVALWVDSTRSTNCLETVGEQYYEEELHL